MRGMKNHKFAKVVSGVLGLVLLYGSLGTVHAYYHVNHACPKNKHNPTAACPGHKPPSDKDRATTHGGVDSLGCGCSAPYDVLMCFFGY